MSARVLVTGSNGFVGAKLCAHLEAAGYEVLGCDMAVPPGSPQRRACDITKTAEVDATIDWALPLDGVFHLAAITFVPEASADPTQVMDVNLQGTIRLLNALKVKAPEARVVFVGSSEVYGPPQSLPMTEEHPLAPANPYAISKAAADHFCRYAHAADGLDVVRMRPFNHSGPGQSDRFVLSSFARQIADMEAGRQVPQMKVGNLEAARDFMHVDDVLRAYELAYAKGKSGDAYNICSGAAWRIQDALDTLIGLAEVEIDVQVDPERLRPVDTPEIFGSHQKFTDATGWNLEKSFENVLADLLGHWRGHG